MKRPDVPARGLVLAAIKLDIRKRQVRYPRMEIDLHTMTGGDRGIERSWPRVRGIGGWLGGGGRAKRKVRSRIRRRGRMTKLSFPKRKIVFGQRPFFVDLLSSMKVVSKTFQPEEFWPDRRDRW